MDKIEPFNQKIMRIELDFAHLIRKPKYESSEKSRKCFPTYSKTYKKMKYVPSPPKIIKNEKNLQEILEDLLDEIYSDERDMSNKTNSNYNGLSDASLYTNKSNFEDHINYISSDYLDALDFEDLNYEVRLWQYRLRVAGDRLGRVLRQREKLKRHQKRLCTALSIILRYLTGDHGTRFNLTPRGAEESSSGEGGYSEWLHAMRLVARLPAGVPQHFRKKLWLTLADRYLAAKGIEWTKAERDCFRGTAQPDDTELGSQILKDLHRTGCSLFCGAEGRENQAMLRRVLLAYARWNKDVGYCQGFNMLAAIILEVMEKSEGSSLKVMIYLVEAVLPEGYFADDLRGLSADMGAFRDLLKIRLPKLANHMDSLQKMSDGGGVEPPLPDVFTMQWFLTLYTTWLPREPLLKVWDLIMLDGNEILLLTALAIWEILQDQILSTRSADEYYSCMGNGARAIWEAGDCIVAKVITLGTVPELPRLRNMHRYKVTPPVPSTAPATYQPPLQTAMRKGLRLFYSEDEGDSSDDGNRLAMTSMLPRREERLAVGDRLSLDIGQLKKQYARLRERQRQAHVILAAACARHAAVGVPTSPTSLTVNSFLLGKSAIVSNKGRRLGPPPGTVPPSRKPLELKDRGNVTIDWKVEHDRKLLNRRNSVKWKDIKKNKNLDRARKPSIESDESGDGVIISEKEVHEMMATVRSRTSSQSSSYSSHTDTSSDTSLCDDIDKDDSETETPNESKKNVVEAPNFKVKNEEDNNFISFADDQVNSEIDEAINVASDIDNNVKDLFYDSIDLAQDEVKSDDFNKEDMTSSTFMNKIKIQNESIDEKLNISNKTEDCTKINKILTNQSINSTIYSSSDTLISLSRVAENENDIVEQYFQENDIISPNIEIDDSYQNINVKIPSMDNKYRTKLNLSDINVSDIESPLRSPGGESIVVSEDEPMIPLQIDEYFEDSPDFFGARITVTDPKCSLISSRRPSKRYSKPTKKPDSLTLKSNNNEYLNEIERSLSLPQNIDNNPDTIDMPLYDCPDKNKLTTDKVFDDVKEKYSFPSPKDYILEIGRKNSEKALQIIQENSKILSRILMKQNKCIKSPLDAENFAKTYKEDSNSYSEKEEHKNISIGSPVLKESTSDSLIGYKHVSHDTDRTKSRVIKSRPLSINDPFSFDINSLSTSDFANEPKSSSVENLANKTDLYGWENKGFFEKYQDKYKQLSPKERDAVLDRTCYDFSSNLRSKLPLSSDWRLQTFLDETKSNANSTSHDIICKDVSPIDKQRTSDFMLSTKYNDFVLSRASDICSKTVEHVPKVCRSIDETSDFANVVTSSISFTYERSADDESPAEAKSNSSDTLCHIASLDQVSTPISPKVFPRESPLLSKESKGGGKLDSDDTCSAITSLLETDTYSSLSYQRSSPTGSYPFPTKPAMRLPKELGIRLGMYPRDALSSSPK